MFETICKQTTKTNFLFYEGRHKQNILKLAFINSFMNVCWLELKVALSMEQFVIRESGTVRTFAKLYTPSTKNILMKLLSTAIWADK